MLWRVKITAILRSIKKTLNESWLRDDALDGPVLILTIFPLSFRIFCLAQMM